MWYAYFFIASDNGFIRSEIACSASCLSFAAFSTCCFISRYSVFVVNSSFSFLSVSSLFCVCSSSSWRFSFCANMCFCSACVFSKSIISCFISFNLSISCWLCLIVFIAASI